MKTIFLISGMLMATSSWALKCDRSIVEADYQRVQTFEASGQSACRGNPGKLMSDCRNAGFQSCRDIQTDGHASCDFIIEGEKSYPKTAAGRKAILCDRFYDCGVEAMRKDIDGIAGFMRFQSMADTEGCQVVAHGPNVNGSELRQDRNELREGADAVGNTKVIRR